MAPRSVFQASAPADARNPTRSPNFDALVHPRDGRSGPWLQVKGAMCYPTTLTGRTRGRWAKGRMPGDVTGKVKLWSRQG